LCGLGRRGFSGRGDRCCPIGSGVAGADRDKRGTDLDGLVLLDEDRLDDSRNRRRNLGVNLVGRDLEQWLVYFDAVTDLLQPAGYRTLGDTLAECGKVDGFAHQ
jgi:hypothetical protein